MGKEKSINQAESNAEAAVQFNKNQAEIGSTQIWEGIDNGQQSVPNAENYKDILDSMEAFYASIAAETTPLSHLRDIQPNTESVETRPSENTKKKLLILRDLVTKNFSLLLHPGRSIWMKDVLNHLLSLSPDSGVCQKTKSVILQLSAVFYQWSLDYNNASRKLESVAEAQSNAECVKEDLEANVKDFMEVDMMDMSLCTKLTSLQERKRELEEQINSIKAEIADFTAQRVDIAKKKCEVFDTGKMLRAKRDDFRKRLPKLNADQQSAKITQAYIEAEWSKFGEQIIESTNLLEE